MFNLIYYCLQLFYIIIIIINNNFICYFSYLIIFMHLYSIVETVLYMFYEAILNKSVYSLTPLQQCCPPPLSMSQ